MLCPLIVCDLANCVYLLATSSLISIESPLTLHQHVSRSKRNKSTPPSLFLKKRQKFVGGRTTKTIHYVRDILCLPSSWCKNPHHVAIPRGEKRNALAENGLLGKIEFNSEMNSDDIISEVCKVFASPMGLDERSLSEGKTFRFQFLQRTGAGSRTLCVPSVADTFEWNGKHVSTLAKSGGIIYILALDELILEVCVFLIIKLFEMHS